MSDTGKIFKGLVYLAIQNDIVVRFAPLKYNNGRLHGNKIAIRQDQQTVEEYNYTLAYELAHVYLHYDKGNIIQNDGSYEEQADRAAKMILDSLAVLLKIRLGDKWTPLDGLDNLVFTNEFGSVVTLNTMQYYMRHIQDMIRRDGTEFAPIHIHTLRHTFATRAIEAGMQPQVLKTILGHSSLAMTMDLYSHVLPDTKTEEMQKIANLF